MRETVWGWCVVVDVVGVEVFEGKLFGVGVLWWMWLGWKCLRETVWGWCVVVDVVGVEVFGVDVFCVEVFGSESILVALEVFGMEVFGVEVFELDTSALFGVFASDVVTVMFDAR